MIHNECHSIELDSLNATHIVLLIMILLLKSAAGFLLRFSYDNDRCEMEKLKDI